MRGNRALCGLVLLVVVACGTDAPRPRPPADDAPAARTPIRFAAVGDIGEGNDVQRRVGDRIAALHAAEPIDVILLLGDIIYPDGAGHRFEERFAEPWRAVLDREIPMAAALGNHDAETRGGSEVMDLFRMPSRYYAFRRGPATFFALDTNRFDAEQLDWLRDELASTRTPWRIVFMHAPAYSSGMHGSTEHVRRGLDPIAREFEIQLVLAGHDHDYERTHPIGGTVHVVAGTGCCLRAVGASDFTAFASSEPGVVVGEADDDGLVLRFVSADGRVLDRVTLEAPVQAEEPIVQGGRR